jgi:DNA repair protein RadD
MPDHPPIVPRPDQLEAHDCIIAALDAGIHRPLAIEPMAWGKSVLLAMLAATLFARGLRVLVLAHRKELLEQNSGALGRIASDLDVGICSASLDSDRLDARVVIGGTATVYRRLERLGHIDIILLDEAHFLSANTTSMLPIIRAALGGPPLVGVTATPFRTDSGLLIEAGIFDQIVHETPLAEALAAGLLCPLVVKTPCAGRIDLSAVPIIKGEFHAGALEAAAMAGDVTTQAVARIVAVAREEARRSWLIFASGVAHAQQIGDELDRHRIAHAVVTGGTNNDERGESIARFRREGITALIGCNIFTTGFDATNVDLVAFLRATCSPVLWAQSMGRGMRVQPGKETCRVLDFGDNVLRHGPINDIRLRGRDKRNDANAAVSRVRICPHCDEVNARDARICINCGEQLVQSVLPKIAAVASELEVIGGTAAPPDWTRVLAMNGVVHQKVDAQPSFRLNYRTEVGLISDFMPLQHPSSGARWHAGRKWRELSLRRQAAPPLTAEEAEQRFRHGELRQPTRLLVERAGGWWRVVAAEFVT